MKARIFAAGRPLLQNHDWPLGVECAWPAAMQPVKTVGAAYRPRWSARFLRAALVALCLALWQLGQGTYIQAKAWLAQRDFVSPEDIQDLAFDVMRHRLILSYEAEAEGITTDYVIKEIIARVAVP